MSISKHKPVIKNRINEIKNSIMKHLFTLFAFCAIAPAFAQQKMPVIPENACQKVFKAKPVLANGENNPFTSSENRYVNAFSQYACDTIGHTRYDLQSNCSAPSGRLTLFPDETMATVWTRGIDASGSDRGTGYNYYYTYDWGYNIDPERLEDQRAGWPSHARLGTNGEIVVSHKSGSPAPLFMLKREIKGTGDWMQSTIPLPEDAPGLLWPRMVTGGSDKNQVHIISLTTPVDNSGALYHGQDGALIYSRSLDGGISWDRNEVIPGLDSAFYPGWTADRYCLAEPRYNTLAFAVSNAADDLILMKSGDNGDTWQKTVVWHYPGQAGDVIYKPDGAVSVVIDFCNKVHLFFGVVLSNAAGDLFPYQSGIAYWNEDMPVWEGDDQYLAGCLNPDTLSNQNLLVASPVDVDGNGQWDVLGDCGDYNVGAVSMPQAKVDGSGFGILAWSAVTENCNYMGMDYRHIWVIKTTGNFSEFSSPVDITAPFDPDNNAECVYPGVCQQPSLSCPASYYLIYQRDQLPGLQSPTDPSENYIICSSELGYVPGTGEPAEAKLLVSQNRPNPFTGKTQAEITLTKPASVSLEVTTLTGCSKWNKDYGTASAGVHTLIIDATGLAAGVYFYTVTAGSRKMTMKMMVL